MQTWKARPDDTAAQVQTGLATNRDYEATLLDAAAMNVQKSIVPKKYPDNKFGTLFGIEKDGSSPSRFTLAPSHQPP